MSDKLTVEIYPDADAIANEGTPEGGSTTFNGVDFVSFVNGETYGVPALVAPNPKDGPGAKPRAAKGQRVLYINTALVPLFAIERVQG